MSSLASGFSWSEIRDGMRIDWNVGVRMDDGNVVVVPGHRLCLAVRGKDYCYDGPLDDGTHLSYATRGTGGMTHDDPDDRPPEIFGGA